MAERGHTGRTVALVGGAGVVAWWLLSRGRGWGLHGPGAHGSANGERSHRRCTVWIRADRIEIDGTAANLPTVVATCRAAGEAEVHATGDAITHVVREVLAALHAAGVVVYTPPDLAGIVSSESLR